MPPRPGRVEDGLDARASSDASPGAIPVRTIKLCPATTTRPTTLRLAIDRAIVELARSGRDGRAISLTAQPRATA
jgi:hypothetical protein